MPGLPVYQAFTPEQLAKLDSAQYRVTRVLGQAYLPLTGSTIQVRCSMQFLSETPCGSLIKDHLGLNLLQTWKRLGGINPLVS